MIMRTWTVTDRCGNPTQKTQHITVRDITNPVILQQASNQTAECTGSDPGNNAAYLNWLNTQGGGTATDVCGSGPLIWTNNAAAQTWTSDGCTSSISVTFTATDDCGNLTTTTATFTVDDTTLPILVGVPADATVECDAIPAAAVTATDNCDPTLTVEFNETSTVVEGCGTITRTWTATDDCGHFSTATQTINVQDITAPVIAALPAATTIDCPAAPAFAQATATDLCDATVTLTRTPGTTPGNYAGNFSATRTWTATDDCCNFSTATQTINVQDITAPVIDALPAATTIDCPAAPAFAQATATDLCDATVTLTRTPGTTPGNYAGNFSATRTWTATDD